MHPSRVTSPRARWWLLAATLVALALAASANGVANGFTYDDVYIIQKNGVVHSLASWWQFFAQSYWPKSWGGDGYRPVTILAFAIEWAIGGGAPWVFHVVNILLYAATTVALFWVATAFLPRPAAWVAAALFAVHPVHVEAVANVVGQSELAVALLLTIAVGIYAHRRLATSPVDAFAPRTIAALALLYAVALFVKEHAIVLPALIVAAELALDDERRTWRARAAAIRPTLLVLTLVAVTYLGVRSLAKGGEITGFQPFVVFQALGLSHANRVLTMLGVVPEWVRLLFWPAHLRTEYAPPYIDIAEGPALSQLPGLLIVLGILGLAVVLWRRRAGKPAAFGIGWFCIVLLPTSNFVVPAGIILAERTLFLPSAGVTLALGALAAWLLPRLSTIGRPDPAAPSPDAAPVARRRVIPVLAHLALGAILVAAIVRSATRTRVWHDNDRLFRQAVVDAPDSYRAHYMLGAWEFENRRLKQGEHEYRRALQLFPYDPFLAYNFAQQYQQYGMCKAAVPLYQWTFRVADTFMRGNGRANLALCLIETGHGAEARVQALDAIRLGGASLSAFREVVRAADSVIALTGNGSGGTRRSVNSGMSTDRKTPESPQKARPVGTAARAAEIVSR